MENKVLLKRDQVETKYKWAIEDLFTNEDEWKKEYESTKLLLDQVDAYKGKLGNSSNELANFLKLEDEIAYHIERIYVYANQKFHEDTGVSKYQALSDQAGNLSMLFDTKTSFVIPEILEIPEDTLKLFLEEDQALKVYKFLIEEIYRKKAHTLSAEMEEIIAGTGEMAESPSNIFSIFNNADIKFPSIEDENGEMVEITHGRYTSFLESTEERVRRDAFKNLYGTYAKFKNTLAATYSSSVKKDAFFSKVKKYPSTMAMRLFGSNIPMEVYTNLIDSVHDNLHLMHRYVALRKKLLKVDELHMYDLYTPIVKEANKNISFEKAKELVYEGLAPLGENYRKILMEGFNNRWIDIYENEGKRSGAYSWGAYGTHPYVLLNYQNNLNNVFTLAHEMGHALHSYHSDEALPITYASYKIFVAEVASTCNEALLMEYLLDHTKDKKERAYLINYFLEQFRGTLFRQTMFAEFEMKTHQMSQDGEALTSSTLSKVYHDLVATYHGEDIVIDPEIDLEWARIPHFYTSFYVYQYATGYAAAISLSRKILKEGKSAADNYINKFLKGGSSDYPIELLKKAGVDMSTKEPISNALELFKTLLDEMEELLIVN